MDGADAGSTSWRWRFAGVVGGDHRPDPDDDERRDPDERPDNGKNEEPRHQIEDHEHDSFADLAGVERADSRDEHRKNQCQHRAPTTDPCHDFLRGLDLPYGML